MTYKDMCKTVVKAAKILNPNSTLTPKQVWEISPTGEIWPVHALYESALVILSEREGEPK